MAKVARPREPKRRRKLLRAEKPYRERGIRLLAGVDEAGVGPLAGPVVAAAVIMPVSSKITQAYDSKGLPPAFRLELAERIRGEAVAWSVGIARPREIDRLNIYWAALAAMRRAVERLVPAPELVLVDARTIPRLVVTQEAHVGGDARFYQIACASILAKTVRDAIMERLDRRFPGYGFARHKGYPTPEHRDAIRELGPCAAHRRSFRWLPEDPDQEVLDLWGDAAVDADPGRGTRAEASGDAAAGPAPLRPASADQNPMML
jgi:ribonuclease HII